MKDAICKAFCDDILVRQVPAGLAVSAAFVGADGDRLGFYILGPDNQGQYRVEDDGMVVPVLEASGADFTSDTRQTAFNSLLAEYAATFSEEERTISINGLSEDEIPEMALAFSALLLRVQDMMLMTYERVASTFKEEVSARIYEMMKGQANVESDTPIHPELIESPQADLVIRAKGRDPVAVFIVLSDKHLLESMLLATDAAYHFNVPCSVVSLIESDSSVSRKTLKLAMSRVSPMFYRGQEKASMAGIVKESLGIVPGPFH